ncbi:unnamed protein product [Haemonchus placei]|uniref:Secreted protein n=1 Tax=Haemonchus placei TaxID=6290 RepID=A0A0N4WQX7_HAEPC|nr:unnamed protein product [Haemonchus placei]
MFIYPFLVTAISAAYIRSQGVNNGETPGAPGLPGSPSSPGTNIPMSGAPNFPYGYGPKNGGFYPYGYPPWIGNYPPFWSSPMGDDHHPFGYGPYSGGYYPYGYGPFSGGYYPYGYNPTSGGFTLYGYGLLDFSSELGKGSSQNGGGLPASEVPSVGGFGLSNEE